MEESVSPELAQANEPEPSQDPLDTSSQEPASVSEVNDQKEQCDVSEEKVEDSEKSSKPSREFKKTWGFRRTTIAKREIPGDMAAETPEGKGAPVRRSGRQAKRTDKLEEFLVTVKRGRGTGRRSGPSRLEGGDPPSQTPTDAETASEASFDGNAEAKTEERKAALPEKRKRGRGRARRAVKPKAGGGSVSEDGSSENEEENGGDVTKDTQEHVETEPSIEDKKDEESKDGEVMDVKKEEEDDEEEKIIKSKESSNESVNRRPVKAVSKDSKKDTTSKKGAKLRKENKEDDDDDDEDDNDDEDDESSSSESDSDGYDPNALYCICRQKHNKRFMICCDRCEEWFHGDCVGITEARGRLMERNGEDYVCPNCNTQRGQTPKGHASTPAAENGKRPAALPRKTEPSLAAGGTPTSSSNAVATTEEKAADDLGIKGRIEKATNPSGKKKIKIFQPVAAEGSSLPKCIGPGCERDALPDSVYCGNDCILRHAAAAMKTITTDGKDSKQKEKSKPKVQKKTTNKSAHKKTSGPERRSSNQAEEEDSDSGAEENDDDDDDEDKHAEEHPPPPAMSSWSSDHNYIAVTPEKTTPISPSVLNKASTAQKDKEKEDNEDIKPEKETASADKKTPASNVAPKGGKKSPGSKGTKAAAVLSPMKGKTSAAPLSSARDSKKQPLPLSKLGKSKKPGPPPLPIPGLSPPVPTGSRHHVSGALRVAKSTFTIPKKQPQVGQKETAEPGPSLPSKTPPSSVSSTPSTQHSLSKPAQSAAPAAPPQPPPNNQMRSNIRRSLTDILYKRVSDSDDLSMSESEVGKLAVTIEKEMFNLYMNTDNKYKNKYRSLMFNLKDPKNKGLFYRVIGGEISPFRLVRLSPEELLSKEMSDWRKTEISEGLDIGGKSQSGQSKTGSRQDGVPTDVDMEEAPPMSDGDVCIPATSQSPRLASSADPQEDARPTSAPQVSASTGKTSAMPDIFSSMLKDTTAEHRAHLFDLNCKICTGQKSADDEPPSKKTKMSVPKKPEPPIKSKPEPRPSKAPAVDLPQTSSYSSVETSMSESVSMMEDPTSKLPVIQAPVTAAVPAVSSVTITRRDPRTAGHRSSAPVSQTGPDICIPAVQASVPVPVPVELPGVEVKGPLPMPPAAPVSLPRPGTHKGASSHFGSSTPSSVSEPPPEDETALFLSGQEMMWKGFINMHTVAKFVTKAYMVSGSFEHIKEDLPDTIHIGGRISPHTVWDYVGKLKTSLSKELCLIRFHPATEEEEVAYVSLFSYFSSRKRFGVVANSNKRIKDLYLIPLSSKDPLPAKLLPFDGPGLEPARPNLLLGLLICQKDKKRPGAPLENEEKRSKIIRDDETGLPKLSTVGKSEIKQDKGLRSSLDAISTTPPGTPPPLSATEPSSSTAVASVFSLLSSVKASAVTTSTGNNSPSSNVTAVPAVSSTPLQTILKTLFGKKKQDTDVSSPSDQSAADASVPSVSLLDPIVQQFAITKGKEVEIQDDRPYDPEEEYDPTVGYGTEKTHDTTKVSVPIKQPLGSSGVVDDIAYDPEDDSIFDDVRVDPGSKKLTEQQKVLEDKQTEEEKRHLEGHEESIHQIPETLISQPATSILASSQLLQLGKKVEELVAKSSGAPVINQRRDPRQSRDPRQAAANRRQTSDSVEKEELSPVTTDKPTLQQATVIDASPSQACTTTDTPTTLLPLSVDASVEEPSTTTDTQVTQMTQVTATLDSQQVEPTIPQDASTPEEGGISEVLPFLETENTEVSIPLLGEKIDPELVENYMEKEPEEKPELKDSPIESESKSFEEVWPNSASILKTDQVSTSGLPIESTATTYYSISTISSSSTSVHSGMQQDASHDNSSYMDSHASHIQHITTTNPTTIPPPMSFPPPIGPPPILGPPPMQGPLPMAVPPPMHLPPPMSGPPPMQIPPMQGPPPSLGEKDSQYPLPGSYPPYQNQWGSGPQYDAPRGPPPPNFAPRGPPPFQPVSQRVPPPPQMFDNSIPPQHIGPRGPPPGPPPLGPPPPNFEGQRFNGPPPPFGFSGPRGPPPPFPGPLPNHFDNRAPPPSHFSGPRGPPPPHNIGDHGPPPNISRGPGDKYDDSGSSYHQRKEQPQIPSQGPPFRGPPPNHFDGRRGPPGPTGDMSGQRFPPPSQFRGSPQHRGSFEEPQRSSSQDFERHRGSSVEQFGGPRGPPPGHYDKDAVPQSTRYNYNEDNPNDVRPVRGPLLPTPPEGPIPVPGRVGGHSPETHRDDHWRRHSPEMRRRSCSTRDGSEPHSRPSRFDGTSRDRDGPSRLSEERQRDLSEDRRRERDREGGHGGRSWGWNREHEWDRGRERDRERDRSRERDRERGRSREREREREREHSRERDRSRGRESDRHRDGDSEKRRDRDRDRDRGREREQDRKDHDRDRAKIRDRDRDRDRDSRDRRRERSRSRDRERGKDRDRRDRDRDRDKDRGKEKDRDRRDKSRSKEKKDDRKEKSDSRANEKSVDSETQS